MPGLAMMYDKVVEKPMEMVLDGVRLEGLTKLIAQGYSTGSTFTTPDMHKMPIEEWRENVKKLDDKWKRTHKGPYPTDLHLSTVWMPQKLVTKDGKSPKIIQAYTPVKYGLPIADLTEETYGELKQRIEKESMRAVEHIKGVDVKGEVNAFYIGNLREDWVVPSSARQCMPICGDSFLDRPARDIFVPRIAYELCLFEIEN